MMQSRQDGVSRGEIGHLTLFVSCIVLTALALVFAAEGLGLVGALLIAPVGLLGLWMTRE